MKASKKELLLTTLVCLLPILAGAVLYPQLPETMAVHWSADGVEDGWMPRAAAVFGLPTLVAALNFVCFCAAERDPGRANMSAALRTVALWICPAVSLLCGTVALGTGLGYEMKVGTLAPLFVGVLYLAIGNWLPKTKRSCTLGVRLPWTLASEENWNHTHRVTGFLWVLTGLAAIVLTLLRACSGTVLIVLLLAAALVPIVYSLCYYLRHERGRDA